MLIEVAIYDGKIEEAQAQAEILKGIIDKAAAEHNENIKRAIAYTKERRKSDPTYGFSKKQLEQRAKAAEKRTRHGEYK